MGKIDALGAFVTRWKVRNDTEGAELSFAVSFGDAALVVEATIRLFVADPIIVIILAILRFHVAIACFAGCFSAGTPPHAGDGHADLRRPPDVAETGCGGACSGYA
ncbi:hypothetical protein O206_19860 [Ochrobactrum sp. EGD-AQ16]|uniref:hypothetical protein n=1 Tax=Brucella intermedia TaxID=94625 RepID=UPI0003962BED|nr:hypothetical protein [Brucella intermedia]ERI15335.1 hypothetical protein O206_19860 [Ochrobactrum sp. EGD-AQ16]